MNGLRSFLTACLVLATSACAFGPLSTSWKAKVDHEIGQLGARNWIVIAEASFPAHSRANVHQLAVPVEVPEAVDYVINSLERTEHVRPRVYLTRELNAVENDYAPGIDVMRKRILQSLHSHETNILEQQSLLTLLGDADKNYRVLVIRTQSALPYSSVFMELQPGYWDSESEQRLRDQLDRQLRERVTRP